MAQIGNCPWTMALHCPRWLLENWTKKLPRPTDKRSSGSQVAVAAGSEEEVFSGCAAPEENFGLFKDTAKNFVLM